MEKKQARDLIQELFTKAFSKDRYEYFLLNLLNAFEPRGVHYTGNNIPDSFKQHINQYWRVGKYVDPDREEMDLLVVEVKSLSKLERARHSLRNFAVDRLKTFKKESSLIAFYSKEDGGDDWRFSYVKIEHESYKDETGKVKIKQDLTPAKRYSFLVGIHENSHTAAKQLLPILEMDYANPRISEVEAAFSIERVSEEFFEQYDALFKKLAEHLKRQHFFRQDNIEDINQSVSRFAKKLLGQIVFLYFLQKKGWLGVPKDRKWGHGEKRFMSERFKQVINEGNNYYHDFLQYLFYEALAKERKDQTDPSFYGRFSCKIPFLNGGLFEAEYDWKKDKIDIPNELFHNEDKNKAGDKGTGILDVFDRYNFTIKEDEPLEKEVAVDPEMLGKVFESMLDITERKSKGAFYTPREIVHYMCQESLIHYLDNTLNTYAADDDSGGDMFSEKVETNIKVPREDIEVLIRKGHLALENDKRVLNSGRETDTYSFILSDKIRNHAKEIDKALETIKVCDPAIGSGAFPLGLLNEIINARWTLAPHSKNKMSEYELKRHAICESIYGVDIDASAIDIARLRLWLSLIVDEDNYDNIVALPNLDYRIVKGNSLIGAPNDVLDELDKQNELERSIKEFTSVTDEKRKLVLRNIINKKVESLLNSFSKSFGYRIDFDFHLYFSEVWHNKAGFDIVIGNPPYVQIQKFSGLQIQDALEKQRYETFSKSGDVYCLFYEKGHRILRKGGVLSFITSNKWMLADYGKKLRSFFSVKTQPLTLINFSSYQVFPTATVDTNVLILRKMKRNKDLNACLINSSFTRSTRLETFVANNHIMLKALTEESWIISSKEEERIRKQIEAAGVPLDKWNIAINYGIKTGYNDAFIIGDKKRMELIAKDPKSAKIIKPLLLGRNIKRYRVNYEDLWIINTHNGYHDTQPIHIDDYPAIKAHLHKYMSMLEERQDKGVTPYNLRSCAYMEDFEKEKIVWGNLALSCQFALADAGTYICAPSPLISGGDRYLLAILNSKVADFYIRSFGVSRSGGYFEYKPMFVKKLPVPQIHIDKMEPFQVIADYVIFATKKSKILEAAFFEQLIDGMVYELYFPDEIKASKKDILLYVGELEPLTNEMREVEKLAVVKRQFDRLYDPNHPVRNNIETLDSVNVVRTIREAIKR